MIPLRGLGRENKVSILTEKFMGSSTTAAVHLDLGLCTHVWVFEFRGVAVIDKLLFT